MRPPIAVGVQIFPAEARCPLRMGGHALVPASDHDIIELLRRPALTLHEPAAALLAPDRLDRDHPGVETDQRPDAATIRE
jgi:hypothetical protein